MWCCCKSPADEDGYLSLGYAVDSVWEAAGGSGRHSRSQCQRAGDSQAADACLGFVGRWQPRRRQQAAPPSITTPDGQLRPLRQIKEGRLYRLMIAIYLNPFILNLCRDLFGRATGALAFRRASPFALPRLALGLRHDGS